MARAQKVRGSGYKLRLEGLSRAGLVSRGKTFCIYLESRGSLWSVVSHGCCGEMTGFAVRPDHSVRWYIGWILTREWEWTSEKEHYCNRLLVFFQSAKWQSWDRSPEVLPCLSLDPSLVPIVSFGAALLLKHGDSGAGIWHLPNFPEKGLEVSGLLLVNIWQLQSPL